ncbi:MULTISPECIES: hypothetical protein [unclassified Leifsonia]|uniref:hypothetical protein n=1 Tax=unclassified Leifsonia TaxID=2663824 RepID=UPI000A875251|nr:MULTISPECIES: hypothetical protein [unclassified Leifsonia]
MTNHDTGGAASVDRDDEALAPEQMMALLNDQQRSVQGQMGGFVPVIMLTWGVVWLLGFGCLWLIDGLQPEFGIPPGVAITVFCVLLVVAVGVSTFLGVRSSRGIRASSASSFTGAVYGMTWWVGCVAIAAFGGALAVNGMDRELANIFYPTAYVLFSGVMFIVAGAIWRAVPSVILGGWTVLVAVVAPYFGYPTHYLVLAIGGGIGFLALGVASAVHLRTLRTKASAPASGARTRA